MTFGPVIRVFTTFHPTSKMYLFEGASDDEKGMPQLYIGTPRTFESGESVVLLQVGPSDEGGWFIKVMTAKGYVGWVHVDCFGKPSNLDQTSTWVEQCP